MPAWESGPQMRARTLVADDGFRWFAGWYDRARDLDCGDGRAEIEVCGAERAPAVRFADAACTEPLVEASTPGAIVWDVLDDSSIVTLEVGEPWDGIAYVHDRGACVVSAYRGAPHRARILEGYAAARREVVAETATFAIVRRAWTDGAYQLASVGGWWSAVDVAEGRTRLRANVVTIGDYSAPVSIHDTARAEDCAPHVVGERTYCLPVQSGQADMADVYSDAECTQPVDAIRYTSPGPILVGDRVLYSTGLRASGTFWGYESAYYTDDFFCRSLGDQRVNTARAEPVTAFVELMPTLE